MEILMEIDETTVGIISAVIAFGAAVLAAFYSHLSIRSSNLSRRQEYFSELRSWADEAIHLLSAAIHLCDLNPAKCEDPSFFNRRHEIRVGLSALIDRGRWFFPNVHHLEIGVHKEDAFRGIRQIVLSSLVYSYQEVEDIDYLSSNTNSEIRERLVAHKRIFVTEIQKILDPRQAEKEFIQSMRQT